ITTLGCKINQYDSAVIQSRLEEKHSFVPFDDAADCYIINTCTVTDRADWEARQLVRRARRLSPLAKVLVTGCYAQVNPADGARSQQKRATARSHGAGQTARRCGVQGNCPDGDTPWWLWTRALAQNRSHLFAGDD